MLFDLIMNLIISVTKDDKERAYRRLETIGVNRNAANIMAAEFDNEWKDAEYESVR